MPNFEARIRTGYQDVQGLVADLNVNGLARDGSSWRNDAPPRVMSDPTRPRLRNAVQPVVANRPALAFAGDIPHYVFTKSQSSRLLLDMDGDFGPQKLDYTFAYELQALGPDATIQQVIAGGSQFGLFARSNPAGNYGWRTDATTGFQAGPHPAGTVVYVLKAGNVMERYIDNALSASGLGAPITLGDESQNPVISIGSSNLISGAYFDGNLRSFRVWNRALLAPEVDFVFQSLAAGGIDHSSGDWAPIENRIWDDKTAIPRRVNPSIVAAHRFLVAKIPAGGNAHIVIEATLNGIVVPDTGLGGDLFSVSVLEKPTLTPPFVGPLVAGWSALQKVRLEDVGHFTLEMRRAAGGAIIFHIDVEEV
jgi:hypothetical protein